MNASGFSHRRLLAHYERIADAPDAIARLRRFVLDLAVRGKLVEQDPADEPASELLKRIAAEKARLVRAGEIRKPKPTKSLDPEQLPLPLPQGWIWGQLDELSPRALADGDWIETKDQSEYGGVRLVQLADVGVGVFLDKSSRFVTTETEVRLNCTRLVVGDVLIARLPNPIGRACLFPDIGQPAITAVDVAILRPDENVSGRYLVIGMNAPSTRQQIEAYGRGATRFRVSTGHLKTVLLPIPPLAEQHRIVAKVDELMALCDRLEAARAEREAARDRLAAASLARLNAPDPDLATFAADARFALRTLPALTTRPDQIKQLRQTILNLAVRGKLVEQDPADEPASDLLARMVKERKAIIARRKIRGATPPAPPSAEDEGFDLPPAWRLCALGQITLITDPNPSHRYPDYSGGTVPILSTREFDGDDGWNPGTAKLTTQSFWEFQKEICDFAQGDIVFARKGRLGLPRFLPPLTKFTFSHTLFCIKPMTGIDPAYLIWLLRRGEVVSWLTNEMNQNTGVPTLGKAKTERLPVPLPPLAEQHRIVAKVDALMGLCDVLEASLATADTTRRRLLEALLHEALEPAAETLEAAE